MATNVLTGDSIAQGFPGWKNHYSSTPAGNVGDNDNDSFLAVEFQITHWLHVLDGADWLNNGVGSDTAQLVAARISSQLTGIVASGSKVVLHVGINDITTGVPWATYVYYLNEIRTFVSGASGTLYVCDIGPASTNGPGNGTTYDEAKKVLRWNAGLRQYCTDYSLTYIERHSTLGTERAGTSDAGNKYDLDDQYAYNPGADDLHLSKIGAKRFAGIINAAL